MVMFGRKDRRYGAYPKYVHIPYHTCPKILLPADLSENRVDLKQCRPNRTSHSVASDRDLHCLLGSVVQVSKNIGT